MTDLLALERAARALLPESHHSPERCRALMELGGALVPDLRLADREEAGWLWLLVRDGELSEAAWQGWVERVREGER